jgi:WD40 repeat protein
MKDDERFTPESVDEQVDQFSSLDADESLLSNARVVQRLHALYEADKRSTERVWQRLAQRVSQHDGNARQLEVLKGLQPERTEHMQQLSHLPQQPHKHNPFWQGLNLLAVVLIMAVLVGSLVTVFHFARLKSGVQTGAPGSSTPAPASIGKIVYSTPLENGWTVGSVAWSADSQRVAVGVGNNSGEQIEIWDATTGKQKVTVPLSLDPIASPAWSATSNLLAVPTSDAVVIVNGSTGKIGASYPAPSKAGLSTTATTASTGKTFLSTFVPLGGAPNFGGIAWSPDGKWIVSTFSSFTSDGVVQVWNPQTGKLAFTLATKPDYFMGTVSWSPDGQYIAVKMAKWDETFQIVVWNVQTRQIVFQQSGNFEGLSWQPGTDNLATATILPGSNSSLPGTPTYGGAILKIWNVKTGQLLKSFAGVDGISWSPDGHEFAYANVGGAPSAKASVTILNVNTGQKVYVYQVSGQAAQTINVDAVWSPDGKYIASAESIQLSTFGKQSYIVKVWVA